MRVAVVIPAFNEARAIGRVIGDLPPGVVDEVVVVNNASTDETEANARAAGATVVREGRRGYGQACLAGLAYLRATSPPDVVVFLDGDYSDHPDELPKLLAPSRAARPISCSARASSACGRGWWKRARCCRRRLSATASRAARCGWRGAPG